MVCIYIEIWSIYTYTYIHDIIRYVSSSCFQIYLTKVPAESIPMGSHGIWHRLELRPTSTPRRMARRSAFSPFSEGRNGKIRRFPAKVDFWIFMLISFRCHSCFNGFSMPFPSGLQRSPGLQVTIKSAGSIAFRCHRAVSCLGPGRPAM